MPGRWTDPSAFRADPAATPAVRPTARQSIALLAVLLLVAVAVAVASYVVRPDRARAFDLFHGSLFLADQKSPVAVDLANGKPTLRLLGADKQIGITGTQPMGVVPLDGRTLLVNETTGEFNMVDGSGFVVKHDGGVPLGTPSGQSSAVGVPDGQLGYIVRSTAGRSDVFLVSQATVEAAINATKSVKPRASTSLRGISADTAPGGAGAAGGDLWMLTSGAGAPASQLTIRRFSVPVASSDGAQLQVSTHGTVTGPAAIGTAGPSTVTGGVAATVAGVASSERIRIFAGRAGTHTVTFTAPAGVDAIMPASGAADRLAYVMHGSTGWSIVSVGTDGSGLRGPTPLRDIPAGAKLAPPADSLGSLYTIDQVGGQIYRLEYDGRAGVVPGASTYPFATFGKTVVESRSLSDAYVISRGSRVVINSASHASAIMLFTDGSHSPVRIEKSSALTVNAAGGAEALARTTATNPQPGKPPAGSTPKPKPAAAPPPVNTRIDCKTATQKPHVPQITQATAGSRTVELLWSYPILDNQDCYPTTYLVSFKLLSNSAPQAPSSVRVQSQTGATVGGLFPATRYEITVTAYINGEGTPSQPVDVLTGPEGPAAPTGLAVTTDDAGSWKVSWNSCGAVKQGCVPAQSWTLIPSFCDGLGLSSPPQPMSETADPTSREQPPLTYPGGTALLGRGLQFQVQGVGEQQQAGTPSPKTPCVYSWSPPDPAAMKLSASHPTNTAVGGTTTTTVALAISGSPIAAVGGVGARIAFHLNGPSGEQTKTVPFTGRSSELSTTFDNIVPGAQYQASASVSPPRHPEAAVSLPPQPVTAAANWPSSMSISPDCPETLLACNLTVGFNGISSAEAGGERFSLTSNSEIVCGNTAKSLGLTDFDPATGAVTATLSQLAGFYGSCTVHLTLVEDTTSSTPYFGGVPSPELSATVNLGHATYLNAGQNDFTVQWSDQGGSGAFAQVQYTGAKSDGDVQALATNWHESVTAPGGSACGSDNAQPGSKPRDAAYVQVDGSCVNDFGGSTANWTIAVSYDNATDNTPGGTFTYSLAGPPPGYQPCVPVGFQAVWGATKNAGVTLSYTGNDPSVLAGCSNWSYVLSSPSGVCTTAADGPNGPPTVTIPINCGDPPSQNDWTVVIRWTDTAGNPQSGNPPTTVTGTPPTS